jgi:hypothetical protein
MATIEATINMADAKEVKKTIDKATTALEKANFTYAVLALLAETDCLLSIWWRCDGEFAPVTFFVNANDLFEWASADCETLSPEDLPALRQAIDEVGAIDPMEKEQGFCLWVARKRGMRPQGPAYPKNARIRALFDACGPTRSRAKEG